MYPSGSALWQVLPDPSNLGSGQCHYSPSAQSTVLCCGSCAEGLFQPSGASLRLLGTALQNQQIVLCSFCGTDNIPALLLLRCSCSDVKNRLVVLAQLQSLFHVHSMSQYTPDNCSAPAPVRGPALFADVRSNSGKGHIPRSQLAWQLNRRECAGIGKMLLHAAF